MPAAKEGSDEGEVIAACGEAQNAARGLAQNLLWKDVS